ncbi:unnamed protein product [Vitrella brassicaformis CCMP3155]|uniref:Ribosomal protein n=2 Tax=Vitrella brassicaformis TaxID=1169539 RepID=A0A0G4FEG8_VITBC|nr:unnamed protein product [Vitrella brassicaformis CCMP3155]|eukprot:CEM11361.1 unnamed protein product [Vitrella brassicaformis CCMP3155]
MNASSLPAARFAHQLPCCPPVPPAFRHAQQRTKKYIPFHFIRKRSPSKREPLSSTQALLEQVGVSTKEAPPILASPFQAARLLQAFVSRPERRDPVMFGMRVNVDLKRESVRGVTQLPYGLQADTRLLVFCPDEEAQEMLDAGADFAGLTQPIQDISKGWIGFERCIATPVVMPQVLKIAKTLGPRRLMPNPKSGTITANLREAIKLAKSGAQIEFRAEGEGEINIQLAHTAFLPAQLLENMRHFIREVMKVRTKTTGATTSGEGTFQWPPHQDIRFTPKTDPAIQALKVESKTAPTSEEFILGGSLQARGGPRILLDPTLMHPTSTAYYR